MQLAIPLMLLIFIPILVLFIYKQKRPTKKRIKHVAESTVLNSLPSYKKISRQKNILRKIEISILLLIIVNLLVIISRPMYAIPKIDEQHSRDIVLCLDISGSMSDYLADLITSSEIIMKNNPTDKYSIVLMFNSTFTALPLTRDQATIELKLKELKDKLQPGIYANEVRNAAYDSDSPVEGTDIGTGLLGCLKRFPELEKERSRHVIMFSDMEHDPTGTDPLAAAALYTKYGVNLHILYPEIYKSSNNTIEGSDVVKIANASVNSFKDKNGLNSVINDIFSTIQNSDENEHFVLADNPMPYWISVLILLMLLTIVSAIREGRLL